MGVDCRTNSILSIFAPQHICNFKQGVALTGRNRTGPPCSVDDARPPTRPAAGPPAGSVTDDDRRQRAKQYWPIRRRAVSLQQLSCLFQKRDGCNIVQSRNRSTNEGMPVCTSNYRYYINSLHRSSAWTQLHQTIGTYRVFSRFKRTRDTADTAWALASNAVLASVRTQQ